MLRAALLVAVFVGACTSTTPPAKPTNDTPKPAAPSTDVDAAPGESSPAPMPGQWDCLMDVDCAQTCALGAVSRTWLARNQDADPCDDGCGWKSGSQACRDGECVTLTQDGDIDEACTKRPVPPPR